MKTLSRLTVIGLLLGVGQFVLASQQHATRAKPLLIEPLYAPDNGIVRVRIKRGDASFRHKITLKVDRGNDGTWDESEYLGTLTHDGTHTLQSSIEVSVGDRINVFCNGKNPERPWERDNTNLQQHAIYGT